MTSNILTAVDTSNFSDEVLNSETPVVVDFWATWCGPCKAIAPMLEKVATDKGEALKIVKLDVTPSPRLAAQYSVRSIPALLLFKGGEVVDRHVGKMTEAQFLAFVDPHLGETNPNS